MNVGSDNCFDCVIQQHCTYVQRLARLASLSCAVSNWLV